MLGYSPFMISNENNDNTPQFNFIIGITIAISTSFIQSLGLTIQRKSHVLNENIHPKELRRSACRRPLWHLGFDTYIISNIVGSVFSIGYLPIIILAPLGAVTLVFNAIFAKLLLGDIFNRQTIIGASINIDFFLFFSSSFFSSSILKKKEENVNNHECDQ